MNAAHSNPPDIPHGKLKHTVDRLPKYPSAERMIWRNEQNKIQVYLGDQVVSSRFFPIHKSSDSSVAGYFALADIEDPNSTLHFAELDDQRHVAYDRLLRAMHSLSFFSQSGVEHELLFLNVYQRFLNLVVSNHGQAFREILESLEVSPQQIVLQIAGEPEGDLNLWALASSSYRAHGFKLALHANDAFEAEVALREIRPDYLSVGSDWPLQDLQNTVECAASYQSTQLIARELTDTDTKQRLKDLGIDLSSEVDLRKASLACHTI